MCAVYYFSKKKFLRFLAKVLREILVSWFAKKVEDEEVKEDLSYLGVSSARVLQDIDARMCGNLLQRRCATVFSANLTLHICNGIFLFFPTFCLRFFYRWRCGMVSRIFSLSA